MSDLARRGMRSALSALRGLERAVERWSLPRFANEPDGFEMRWPRALLHPERMTIGNDVKLGPNSNLKCNVGYPGGWMRHPEGRHVTQSFEPRLVIGDRVTATASLQVIAFVSVTIEDDVMFAANVFIADGTHAIISPDIPFKYQGVAQPSPVRIGRGTWIGQNVVIAPGVSIGEMAIIGANSVVTSDVAPRTIVGGVPARVVKAWSAELRAWVRPDAEGI